jgi:hypothetical protein
MGPHIVDDDGDESIANICCFGAFADKNSGINVNVILINYPDLYNAQNTDDGTSQSQQKRTL